MEIIKKLNERTGSFSGYGINHDNQEFTGELKLTPIVNGKGVEISFVATGEDENIYHQEKTIIAPNANNSISLWTLNNNVPFLYEHKLFDGPNAEGADLTLAFKHNNPEDNSKFREVISIDFWDCGDLTYRYAWGIPNKEFAERSSVRMKRVGRILRGKHKADK